MGREKSRMLEADQRGWYEPDGYVCADCVEDEFLKEVVREYACYRECDYCGRRTRSHSAAPVVKLMEPIAKTVFYYFNNPTDAYVPYESSEGGWLLDTIGTHDMLESLGLDCDPGLFEEIAKSFVSDEWVETADGIWLGSHPHEEMSYEWDRFTRIVKHELRYFFDHARSSSIDEEYQPSTLLPNIGSLINQVGLIDSVKTGVELFRARPKNNEEDWPLEDAQELGAPPSEKASAGRMNPAGISYLYLAYDQVTSLTEIGHRESDQSAIGKFRVQRDLRVLNLTRLPQLPSIFDNERREEAEGLIFLASFIKEITKPVKKDGKEHVEYAPTQVVSEYFSVVFQSNDGSYLDGILYPSAVHPSGQNVVLFPTERCFERKFDQVEFIDAWMA